MTWWAPRPLGLSTNQRREWGPQAEGGGGGGVGHVCTQSGPSCAAAVVKSGTDGPLLRSLVGKVHKRGRAAPTCAKKTTLLHLHLHPSATTSTPNPPPPHCRSDARLSDARGETCPWKCCTRTRCHHRSAVETNHRVFGESAPPLLL